jgi:hypothetical protein
MIVVRFPAELGIFVFDVVSGRGLWSKHSLISNEYGGGALSLRVKLPGREADHSPPSIAELK